MKYQEEYEREMQRIQKELEEKATEALRHLVLYGICVIRTTTEGETTIEDPSDYLKNEGNNQHTTKASA